MNVQALFQLGGGTKAVIFPKRLEVRNRMARIQPAGCLRSVVQLGDWFGQEGLVLCQSSVAPTYTLPTLTKQALVLQDGLPRSISLRHLCYKI